jgi:hypothetical protein
MCNLDNITVKPELLFSFFHNFARFEYALKKAGFAKGFGDDLGGGIKSASPDWDRYANYIKNNFDKHENKILKEAVDYIWENPPGQEVVTPAGELLFKTPNYDFNTFDLNVLLVFVRRVRNNLFHGGKYGNIVIDKNTERTEKLLKESLVILDACLKLSPDVKKAYDDVII